MFSSLIFLVIVLLTVNLAPEAHGAYWSASPLSAFFQGALLYALLLAIIVLQNRLFKRSFRFTNQRLSFLVNIELIAFLIVFHFLFAAHRIYSYHAFHSVTSVVSLLLYFVGIALFHYTAYDRVPSIAGRPPSALEYASNSVRFLLPFALPFLLFSLAVDLLSFLPLPWLHDAFSGGDSLHSVGIMLLFSATFMALLFLLLPPIMVRSWRCVPLTDPSPLQRLEAVCQRARFRHAGLLIWTVMRHSLTAAIVGVVAPFRYVMFTNGLLQRLPIEEVEAILAHEIGHSHHRHLLLYPFIVSGMMVVAGLFFLFFGPALTHYLSLHHLLHPSPLWRALLPIALLLPTAFIVAVYFRTIFGAFSRLFERQADLHPFALGIAPDCMIGALDSVAIHSGNSHREPSWHHHSIQQRMDFLRDCRDDPTLVVKHHCKVRRSLQLFFILLTMGAVALLLPRLPNQSWPGYQLGKTLTTASDQIDYLLNHNLRRRVAVKLMDRHGLTENQEIIRDSLLTALQKEEAVEFEGIAEYYGAQLLLWQGHANASGKLMAGAWEKFDFSLGTEETLTDFDQVTKRIIALLSKESDIEEKEHLLRAMSSAKARWRETRRDHESDGQQSESGTGRISAE